MELKDLLATAVRKKKTVDTEWLLLERVELCGTVLLNRPLSIFTLFNIVK